MLSGVFHLHEQQARQVMTPIPAVVTVDMSENVETALRRCVDSGHTRLVVTEDGNTDRIRGHRPRQLARAAADERGPDGVDRAGGQGRADRPRDQAARRPARRPPARARVDGGGGGRVRPDGRHRHDRGHHRGGRGRDRRRDRPGGGRHPPARQRRLVGARPRADHRPPDYGLDLPVDSEAYNSVGGFVFGELGRLPKRGDMVQRQRLLAARGVGAREPHRGGADPRPPRRRARRAGAAAPGRGGRGHAARPGAHAPGPDPSVRAGGYFGRHVVRQAERFAA